MCSFNFELNFEYAFCFPSLTMLDSVVYNLISKLNNSKSRQLFQITRLEYIEVWNPTNLNL